MSLDLLKHLQELIRSGGGSAAKGRPAVFLTTNGVSATPAVRDWLVDSGWNVKVSLDGPGPVHDRWRVLPSGRGTFAQVSAVACELARRMPERFSVTTVLCRGTQPQEVFEAAARLGVRRTELVPVAHRDKEVLPGRSDVQRYERFVRSHARTLCEQGPGTVPELVRFHNSIRRVMGFDLHRVPCGAGRTFLGVGPDGGLYPCFRFIGIEDFRLGRLPAAPSPEAMTAFQNGPGRSLEKRTPCRRCSAASACCGPCFAVSEMFGPGKGSPLKVHCAYARADAKWAAWLVNRLRERDPERLVQFLPAAARDLLPPAPVAAE